MIDAASYWKAAALDDRPMRGAKRHLSVRVGPDDLRRLDDIARAMQALGDGSVPSASRVLRICLDRCHAETDAWR